MEVQALVTADVEGSVGNARMRQITGKHPADITRLLQNLVSRGLLTQDGQGRWTQYYLPSDSDSVHKDGHSVHKGEIPDDQWTELTKIAQAITLKKRLLPKDMELLISHLCKDHWLTRKQIGGLLRRNSDGLRSRFLTSMVAHSRLQLRYSDKPNRTDQAYRAASEITFNAENGG